MKRIHRPIRFGAARLSTLALAATTLAACQTGRDVQIVQPAPGALSDDNVAAIITTANTGEIETAQLALDKSNNSMVREFAQLMITHHEWANEQTIGVLQRTGLSRVSNTTVNQLEMTTEETLESLRARSGEDFDRTYIMTQIDMHRWLINTLDQSLIPSTRTDALETWLRQLRPTLVDHLERAQRIQTSLGR